MSKNREALTSPKQSAISWCKAMFLAYGENGINATISGNMFVAMSEILDDLVGNPKPIYLKYVPSCVVEYRPFSGDGVDDDGYPTDDFLLWLRVLPRRLDSAELYNFLETLEHVWWHSTSSDYTPGLSYDPKQRILTLNTWGWSGNEDIVDALKFSGFWQMHQIKTWTGGMYELFFPEVESNVC